MDTGDPAVQTPPHLSGSTISAPEPIILDEVPYPISPAYVKSWTEVRAICELIANALDEDPNARVSWADGVLTIADDGPGIPEEGLILGHSTKTAEQIGQFGEGKKLAALVLARSAQIGALRFDTVGYGFIPTVEPRRLLGGLIPSLQSTGMRTRQSEDIWANSISKIVSSTVTSSTLTSTTYPMAAARRTATHPHCLGLARS